MHVCRLFIQHGLLVLWFMLKAFHRHKWAAKMAIIEFQCIEMFIYLGHLYIWKDVIESDTNHNFEPLKTPSSNSFYPLVKY